MMIANFNGNLVISCFSPINVSEENDVLDVYKELSAFVAAFPKHNMLIIGGDFNVHNGKIYTNKRTTCHKITNRNENCFYENATKNELCILSTKFQKRMGKLWTFQDPNGFKV